MRSCTARACWASRTLSLLIHWQAAPVAPFEACPADKVLQHTAMLLTWSGCVDRLAPGAGISLLDAACVYTNDKSMNGTNRMQRACTQMRN